MTALDFKDYKAFMKAQIAENKGFRGYQSQLAEAAGCQRSFLSQVLNGPLDLTRDHAAALIQFWNLTDLESEYFMTLLDLARAGTNALRGFMSRKLQSLRESKRDLSQQLKKNTISDLEAQSTYYSSWYWTAVHILVSIPEFNSAQAVAERLKLPLDQVKNILVKLEQMGLVKRSGNSWTMGQADIHLPETSPMTEMNHTHWRNRAIIDVQKREKAAVHYTSIFAMSKQDAEKVRDLLMKTIIKMREAIIPSPEEELFCFTCDFFKP